MFPNTFRNTFENIFRPNHDSRTLPNQIVRERVLLCAQSAVAVEFFRATHGFLHGLVDLRVFGSNLVFLVQHSAVGICRIFRAYLGHMHNLQGSCASLRFDSPESSHRNSKTLVPRIPIQ